MLNVNVNLVYAFKTFIINNNYSMGRFHQRELNLTTD
jgi:hypothetical protein